MANFDIARALKDKDYFNSLSPEEQEQVRAVGGVGKSEILDEDLESVSGGLEGGEALLATSTSGTRICPVCPSGTGESVQQVVCIC